MTHPTQEDDVKAIRDALAPTKGDGFWINKISVENLRQIYRSGSAACMLAALGNAIDAIDDAKAHIDAQVVRLDAAEKLAADRLELIESDRKQSLRWKDRAEAAEEKARMYEYLRKLNPRQFQDLWTKDVTSGAMFDDLVRAAIARESGK